MNKNKIKINKKKVEIEIHSLPDLISPVLAEYLHTSVTPDMGIEICRGFLNSIFTFTASANGCNKTNNHQ